MRIFMTLQILALALFASAALPARADEPPVRFRSFFWDPQGDIGRAEARKEKACSAVAGSLLVSAFTGKVLRMRKLTGAWLTLGAFATVHCGIAIDDIVKADPSSKPVSPDHWFMVFLRHLQIDPESDLAQELYGEIRGGMDENEFIDRYHLKNEAGYPRSFGSRAEMLTAFRQAKQAFSPAPAASPEVAPKKTERGD